MADDERYARQLQQEEYNTWNQPTSTKSTNTTHSAALLPNIPSDTPMFGFNAQDVMAWANSALAPEPSPTVDISTDVQQPAEKKTDNSDPDVRSENVHHITTDAPTPDAPTSDHVSTAIPEPVEDSSVPVHIIRSSDSRPSHPRPTNKFDALLAESAPLEPIPPSRSAVRVSPYVMTMV